MSIPALEASNLSARRGHGEARRLVLDPIGFTLARGGAVAITGPSGAGKSTLAGIVLGMGPQGLAGRLSFRGDGDAEDAFFGQLAVVEDVSAVTDCWIIQREKLEKAGGFDPRYQNALFDIDLCLRLREMGYRNLWTPAACLRGGRVKDFFLDVGKEYPDYSRDRSVFLEKWASALAAGDPCYHPDLSLKYEDWRIGKKR